MTNEKRTKCKINWLRKFELNNEFEILLQLIGAFFL